jgi:outer membrane protein OmpA-like peptidoglycan-associated protein
MNVLELMGSLHDGARAKGWRAAALSGALLAGLAGQAVAQATPALENPSLEHLREQLFPTAKTRGFRPTSAPSVAGLCLETQAEAGRPAGAPRAPAEAATTRNLVVEPVPYAGESAAHVDLSINFPDSSDAPSKDSLKTINTLAALLREPGLKDSRFAVAGHTDASGDEAINLRLSCARAIAVRRALIQRGIAAQRLSAYGFGSQKLLDANNPSSPANRRVEVRKAD